MRKGFPPRVVPGTLILVTLSLTVGCRSTTIASKFFGRDETAVQTAEVLPKNVDREEVAPAGIVLAAPVKTDEIETVGAETAEESLLASEDPFRDQPAADEMVEVPGEMGQEEQRYLALLEQDPDRAATWNDLGAYYLSQEYWEAAADALEKAVALDPERNLYRNNLAIALIRAGYVSDGLSEFTHSVGAAAAHYNVGYLLMQEGKEAESARQFLLAMMKDPELEEASYWLNVLADKGVFSPSPTALRQAADPSEPESVPADGSDEAERVESE